MFATVDVEKVLVFVESLVTPADTPKAAAGLGA
jgi:hypothetical protein